MAVRAYTGQFVIGDLPGSWPIHFMALSNAGLGVTGLAAGFTVRRALPGESPSVNITSSVAIVENDATNFPGLYTLYLDGATVAASGSVAIRLTGAGIDDVVIVLTKLPREAVLVA